MWAARALLPPPHHYDLMEHPISKFISADSKRTKYFNAGDRKESKGKFFSETPGVASLV